MTVEQRIQRLEEMVDWLIRHELNGDPVSTAPDAVLMIRDRIRKEREQSNRSEAL
jgi:hypothetical protein